MSGRSLLDPLRFVSVPLVPFRIGTGTPPCMLTIPLVDQPPIQGGVPVPILNGTSGTDTNRNGSSNDRPLNTGDPFLHKSPMDGFLNPASFSSFTCPTSINFGLFCNSPTGRNTLRGPGFVNTDFGVAKKFRFRERMALQFQANFFNLFNHPNFGVPQGSRFGNASEFGKSTFDINGARVTQLALRLDF